MKSKQNTFAVVLIMNERDRATGKGTILYQGDNAGAASQAATDAKADPANKGRYVRTYNYAFLGGGMNDTKI